VYLITAQVDAPEKVLKVEFVGELVFLPIAAVCLIYEESLTTLVSGGDLPNEWSANKRAQILVVGAVWWLCSVVWVPEVLEPEAGNNLLFLGAWMCTAAVMSALLLTAVFVASQGIRACD